jgi:hypothetical protein
MYIELFGLQVTCEGHFSIKDYENMPYTHFIDYEYPLIQHYIKELHKQAEKIKSQNK